MKLNRLSAVTYANGTLYKSSLNEDHNSFYYHYAFITQLATSKEKDPNGKDIDVEKEATEMGLLQFVASDLFYFVSPAPDSGQAPVYLYPWPNAEENFTPMQNENVTTYIQTLNTSSSDATWELGQFCWRKEDSESGGRATIDYYGRCNDSWPRVRIAPKASSDTASP